MPQGSPKLCGKAACQKLVASGVTYCKLHAEAEEERQAKRRKAHDKVRENSNKRLYDGWWQRERVIYLRANPVCVCGCGRLATVVDHIIPHKGDEKLFRDKTNWQGMTNPCHSRKTAREDGGHGNPIKANAAPPITPARRGG